MEDKVQIIVAPMAMGKTHAWVEFLKKQNRKVWILCLSPWISYSDATYGQFADARLEFELYLGTDINKLYKSKCLILQMESLYNISEDYNIKGKKDPGVGWDAFADEPVLFFYHGWVQAC